MQAIIQIANTSPQVYRKQSYTTGYETGHLVILNAVQDIEDIQV